MTVHVGQHLVLWGRNWIVRRTDHDDVELFQTYPWVLERDVLRFKQQELQDYLTPPLPPEIVIPSYDRAAPAADQRISLEQSREWYAGRVRWPWILPADQRLVLAWWQMYVPRLVDGLRDLCATFNTRPDHIELPEQFWTWLAEQRAATTGSNT